MKKIFILVFSGAILMAMKNKLFNPVRIGDTVSDSANSDIYNIPLKTLDGTAYINWNLFKGKKILIVNVASECGYTPQYEGLQKLYESRKDKLVILGCPCNQFGNQEPGDSNQIDEFCRKNYGVTFPLSEKLEVKGENQHPMYKWLTRKSLNGVLDAEVKWNFNKFLISEEGKLIAYFPSKTKPGDSALLKWIDL